MKLIQLGITLSNTNGCSPSNPTWQFNFHFQKDTDRSEPEAIKLLTEAGINFDQLATDGIDPKCFARHFSMSGLGSNKKLTWLAFNSKFDFAYLLNIFMPLPNTQSEFLLKIKDLCPRVFDVKHLGLGNLERQLSQEGIRMLGQH